MLNGPSVRWMPTAPSTSRMATLMIPALGDSIRMYAIEVSIPGSTSGASMMTHARFRNGRSVRSTSHAHVVATTMLTTVTPSANSTVFQTASAVAGLLAMASKFWRLNPPGSDGRRPSENAIRTRKARGAPMNVSSISATAMPIRFCWRNWMVARIGLGS